MEFRLFVAGRMFRFIRLCVISQLFLQVIQGLKFSLHARQLLWMVQRSEASAVEVTVVLWVEIPRFG